jgi:hypothetical protein
MAAAAALAIYAPVRAQPAPSTAPPSANTPTPPATSAPSQMNRMPAGGRATSDRGMGTGSRTHAHHQRHATQSVRNSSAGGSAEQLNRERSRPLPEQQSKLYEPDARRRESDVGEHKSVSTVLIGARSAGNSIVAGEACALPVAELEAVGNTHGPPSPVTCHPGLAAVR